MFLTFPRHWTLETNVAVLLMSVFVHLPQCSYIERTRDSLCIMGNTGDCKKWTSSPEGLWTTL